MYCQICKSKEATIHLTEINEGVRSEMHICDKCAQQQGIAINSQVPLNELLSNLLGSQPSDEEIFGSSRTEKECPQCGYNMEKFTKEALLGCPHDYEVFEEELLPLIKKAHNYHSRHCGKVPSKIPQEKKDNIELSKLKDKLNQAVRNENYEMAAKLRDQISKLSD